MVKAGEFSLEKEVARLIRVYAAGNSEIVPGTATGTTVVFISIALTYDCAGKADIETDWFQVNTTLFYVRHATGVAVEIREIAEHRMNKNAE